MHEASLMENILRQAENELSAYDVRQVNSITVQAGPLANILPDAFSFAFEAMTREKALFRGSELQVEHLPIIARCAHCGTEYHGDHIPPCCPQCGQNRMSIIGGDEVYLFAIDFEENES